MTETYIPGYIKRTIGLPSTPTLIREESNCICVKEPSALELQTSRRSFINRARALLKLLGLDPTPANVNRIQQDPLDPTILSVNGKFYKVLDNNETLEELELIILTHPERLPANFLALFFTKSFLHNIDFKVIRIVAESLRKANTIDSIWAMHQLIASDTQVKSHIQEIIDHVGIETLFYKDKINQSVYNSNNYTIIEFKPINTIFAEYNCNEQNIMEAPIE